MKNYSQYSTQALEEILNEHITGQTEYPGEDILAVCGGLVGRKLSKTDAADIYRHYLEVFLPEDVKKTSEP